MTVKIPGSLPEPSVVKKSLKLATTREATDSCLDTLCQQAVGTKFEKRMTSILQEYRVLMQKAYDVLDRNAMAMQEPENYLRQGYTHWSEVETAVETSLNNITDWYEGIVKGIEKPELIACLYEDTETEKLPNGEQDNEPELEI